MGDKIMERQIWVDTKIRYACAREIGHPNEHLVFTGYDAIGGYVYFKSGDIQFFARLNKSGTNIKGGSVRRDS
jgi:hypothetical protein